MFLLDDTVMTDIEIDAIKKQIDDLAEEVIDTQSSLLADGPPNDFDDQLVYLRDKFMDIVNTHPDVFLVKYVELFEAALAENAKEPVS